MNWPFVSRRKYDDLEFELRRARLDCTVRDSEIAHLRDVRKDMIRRFIKMARENRALTHELEAWKSEVR